MKKQFSENDISYSSYLSIIEKGVIKFGYLFIKGIVKNNGTRNVTECLIKIIKYDQNKHVVSTDISYIFGDISPGKARTFHSMTAWPKSAKTYNLSIEELRVQQ